MAGPVTGSSVDKKIPGVLGQNTNAGDGVRGITGTGSGLPLPSAPVGVSGDAKDGFGVFGRSQSGAAIYGHSGSQAGVGGESDSFDGVFGLTHSSAHAGVSGHSAGGPGTYGESQSGPGVQGASQSGRGVVGSSTAAPGVYGHSAKQAGVLGESDQFDGVYGISHAKDHAGVTGFNPGGLAGYFNGNVTVTGNLTVDGDIVLPAGAADCAEVFEVDSCAIEPGTVMVLRDDERLSPCDGPYDPRVAGIVSGAARYRPGLILNGHQNAENQRAIALIGRVYCKADASYGAIRIGDLLTTSPTAGHAMKAQDAPRAFGATLGKALRALPEGQGLIPVLVALQ